MGSRASVATYALIKFHIEKMYLEIYPAPEIIFHQLITDIKGNTLVYLCKVATPVKSNGGKNLERIFLLDQG